MSQRRSASVARKTNETEIIVDLSLDANSQDQAIDIATGIGFLDHVCSAEQLCMSLSINVSRRCSTLLQSMDNSLLVCRAKETCILTITTQQIEYLS